MTGDAASFFARRRVRDAQHLADRVAPSARPRGRARAARARSGNVSATGPGPKIGPVAVGVGAGRGDRPALEHDDVVVDDRPLDVLRTAEHVGRALLQRDEPAHVGVDGGDRTGRLDDLAARRQRDRHAVDLAAHELVGTAGNGGDDEAVGAAGDGVGAEHDAAGVGNEERLDEHGHATGDGQALVHGFAARDDRAHGVDETVPAAHVEHGLEAAGHRRVDAVFDGRRGTHDERAGCRSR